MSLLEQNINKNEWVEENNTIELNAGNNKNRKYQIKAISNSAVNLKKLADNIFKFHHLIFWKSCLEEKNFKELTFAI